MTSKARDVGIQSYCFREFKDNARIAAMVREIGVDKVEVCEVHANFNDLPGWRGIVDQYKAEGISVVSIGVQTFSGKDCEEIWFEAAREAGARHISCHFKIDTFMTAIPKVRRWAGQYGIQVGIHTHGGYMFGGSADVMRYLTDLGSPQIGVFIDSAWVLQIGPHNGDPVRWAKDFSDRITGVHYKDFTFFPDGGFRDVVLGEGCLDLSGFVNALESGGFEGVAIIEYEGDKDTLVSSLKQCLEKIRRA